MTSQTAELLLAFLGVQIEDDRTLPQVVVPEVKTPVGMRRILVEGPIASSHFPLRRLNLDDIGAQARKHLAAVLPEFVSNFEYPHPVEKANFALVHTHRNSSFHVWG